MAFRLHRKRTAASGMTHYLFTDGTYLLTVHTAAWEDTPGHITYPVSAVPIADRQMLPEVWLWKNRMKSLDFPRGILSDQLPKLEEKLRKLEENTLEEMDKIIHAVETGSFEEGDEE